MVSPKMLIRAQDRCPLSQHGRMVPDTMRSSCLKDQTAPCLNPDIRCSRRDCDYTLSPLTHLGVRRAKPCRWVVLLGNTRPGRKPRRAHTNSVDRGETPRATNTSCVTGSFLSRVEDLQATLTARPLIPFVPLGPSKPPPHIPAKDPQKTILSEPMGPVSEEDGRSLEYRLD